MKSLDRLAARRRKFLAAAARALREASRVEAQIAVAVAREFDGGWALTGREREVLGLVARGLCYKEIAAKLNLSVRGVKWHIAGLMDKMKPRERTQAELARMAWRIATEKS